jgi:hypothetical protein
MPKDDELLRSITTFPRLVKYLRDELQWPIEETSFDDLTFDYLPEELGLDPKTAVKIRSIKQLRPLTTGQPWGVFFVEFERKHLPVVVMRRILSALALKKRASAGKSGQAAWQASDLLFVSSFGEEGGRGITFAHFAPDEQGHDLPALKVLGWDGDDTKLHTEAVAESLASSLTWPSNARDINAWRTQWSSAFVLANREVVTTSRELSIQLAKLAVGIRERAKALLASESDRGPLRKLHKAFKEALLHDLTQDGFADMYAQTVAYGLLAARLENPDSPTPLAASALAEMIPPTSPFLKGLLTTFLKVGGHKGYLNFDELGIGDVVDLLRNAKMKAVLLDFGDLKPDEDPVLHFYELFLNKYDHNQKMKRGEFYTPKPVVNFIVRSVDEILRTDFGLTDGLADTMTWGDMAARHPELKIPKGLRSDEPFVQVLDPATGTATFLVEVIDVVYGTMTAKWLGQGKTKAETEVLWNEYVPHHLLPRLCGFEIQMAPYTIAHIKIGLKLRETGYQFASNERVRVFLTNALEAPQEVSGEIDFGLPALAAEARAANQVKMANGCNVITGNPPYSVSSENRSRFAVQLLEKYKSAVRTERNIQPLSDDYIKFIALAQERVLQSHAGVVGLITNSSYLSGLIHRGMREELLRSPGSLRIMDLHGSARTNDAMLTAEHDENIFEILPGVAVLLRSFVPWTRPPAGVTYAELRGSRSGKYAHLTNSTMGSMSVKPVDPAPPNYLLIPMDLGPELEYARHLSITDVFLTYSTGVKTNRDSFLVDFDRPSLEERISKMRSHEIPDRSFAEEYGLEEGPYWHTSREREKVRRQSHWQSNVCRYAYRPFDERWIFYEPDLIEIGRGGASKSIMCRFSFSNIALVTTRQQARPGFAHVFISRSITDMCYLSSKSREPTTVFTLYKSNPSVQSGSLFGKTVDDTGTYNISDKTLEVLEGLYGSRPLPSEVFCYVYAILNSPTYRSRYCNLLKREYPRIPFPGEQPAFLHLSRIGERLARLHLLELPEVERLVPEFFGCGTNNVAKVEYDAAHELVAVNSTQYFAPMPRAVWEHVVGGYHVCQKWLKDRGPKGGEPGRVLSPDDILHYRKIVTAIAKTIELQAEIDRVIAAAGGFPAAFASGTASS